MSSIPSILPEISVPPEGKLQSAPPSGQENFQLHLQTARQENRAQSVPFRAAPLPVEDASPARADHELLDLAALFNPGSAAVQFPAQTALPANGQDNSRGRFSTLTPNSGTTSEILESMLQRNAATAAGPSRQAPQPGPSPAVQIESWSASYRYGNLDQNNGLAAVDQKTGGNVNSTLTVAGLQEQQRVLAAIHHPAEMETIQPGTASAVISRQIDIGSLRQDINSTSIHFNLPNQVATIAETNNSSGGQQTGNGTFFDKGAATTSPAEQMQTAAGENSGETPLIFSLNHGNTPATDSGQSTATNGIGQRFVPGTLVPESHIVDQVVDRFTMNRRLESGSVVLKLHPQELGELRMEIKVEQDNIKAHITTQNPQVQEILDRHMPKLREVLAQQGLILEEVQVSVAEDNQRGDQLFQENQDRQYLHRKGETTRFSSLFATTEPEAPLQAPHPQTESLNVLI